MLLGQMPAYFMINRGEKIARGPRKRVGTNVNAYPRIDIAWLRAGIAGNSIVRARIIFDGPAIGIELQSLYGVIDLLLPVRIELDLLGRQGFNWPGRPDQLESCRLICCLRTRLWWHGAGIVGHPFGIGALTKRRYLPLAAYSRGCRRGRLTSRVNELQFSTSKDRKRPPAT